MLQVKHFMDPIGRDDGHRLWVEPMGLAGELRDLCGVDVVADDFGPPRALWEWFEEHPTQYESFRDLYHWHLSHLPDTPSLLALAFVGTRTNLTLLHQSSDRTRNSAGAFAEFLQKLGNSCAR